MKASQLRGNDTFALVSDVNQVLGNSDGEKLRIYCRLRTYRDGIIGAVDVFNNAVIHIKPDDDVIAVAVAPAW